jgi:hypothetical protein
VTAPTLNGDELVRDRAQLVEAQASRDVGRTLGGVNPHDLDQAGSVADDRVER